MIDTAHRLPATPKPPRGPLEILRHAQEMIHQHSARGSRIDAVVVSHQEHAILRRYQTAVDGRPADPGFPLRLDGIRVMAAEKLQPGQVGVIEMPKKGRTKRASGLIV